MPIKVENLSYTYSKKTPFEKAALSNISFEINDGETVGIVGSTGSGKSTLIQHLNALIKVQEGKIFVDDIDLSNKKIPYQKVRKNVGMLFQYPEYQLFAETVEKDVMFGPLNFGYSKEEAERLAKEALELVGLNYEEIKDKSPLELSGGQKRRVALAGVIAYKPSILVLDEPTAGLDPAGKKDILNLVRQLKLNGTVKIVIMVSHNMDEISEYCDRVIALHNSELIANMPTAEFFYDFNVEDINLITPHPVYITKKLIENGFNLPKSILSEEELFNALYALKVGGKE